MRLRMATFALTVCLVLVPGLSGARVQDQLDALQTAIRVCADPTVMSCDRACALTGRDGFQPPTDLIARISGSETNDRLSRMHQAEQRQ